MAPLPPRHVIVITLKCHNLLYFNRASYIVLEKWYIVQRLFCYFVCFSSVVFAPHFVESSCVHLVYWNKRWGFLLLRYGHPVMPSQVFWLYNSSGIYKYFILYLAKRWLYTISWSVLFVIQYNSSTTPFVKPHTRAMFEKPLKKHGLSNSFKTSFDYHLKLIIPKNKSSLQVSQYFRSVPCYVLYFDEMSRLSLYFHFSLSLTLFIMMYLCILYCEYEIRYLVSNTICKCFNMPRNR